MYTITDFGAVGDGATLNTRAIQAAIETCGSAGGGQVVVPPGTFVTGTLWLRDHVELHLEAGAVLLGSPNLGDYNTLDAYPQNFVASDRTYEDWTGAHLILGIEVRDVSITGPGIIDGNASVFFGEPVHFDPPWFIWRDGLATARDKATGRPGQMVVFCESRDIRIRDVSLRNATCWACFFHGCEDVFVRGVNVDNAPFACNTDGIDIDSCRNVTVSDCIIDTGDDAIAVRGVPARLKDRTRVCERITVTNCVLGSSSSVFRIGVGDGEIRDALFSNIVVTRGGVGVHFNSAFSPRSKGVTISNVRFRGVLMRNVAHPLVVDGGGENATSRIEDIVLDDIRAEGFAPVRISGNSRHNVRNIVLRNMDIVVIANPLKLNARSDYPDTLFQFARADKVTLDRVRVQWAASGPNWQRVLHAEDVTNLDIAGDCRLPEPETGEPRAQPAGAGAA